MAKEWVPISRSQAKIVDTSYYGKKFFTPGRIIADILMAIFPTVPITFGIYIIIFILSKPLNIPDSIQIIATLILSIITFIYFFLLFCSNGITGKEFILDLQSRTMSEFHYLLRDRYTKESKPVNIICLSKFSQIVLLKKQETYDGESYWYYSLEIIGIPPSKTIEIDRSSSEAEISHLQNLGRKLADFLQIPIISEIDVDGEINAQATTSTSETSDALNHIERAVEKIYQTLKSAFGQTHEYRIVNSEGFRSNVDLAYYHRLQSHLVEQGYTWVGDIEDMTVAQELVQYNTRTFIRLMINPTHNTSVAFYHFKPRIFLGFLSEIKAFDCETEFSPEKYLVTTNTSKTPFEAPPGFDVVHLPPNTDYKIVLKTHYQRLQKAISTWRLSPTPLHNLDDILGMQKRMQQAKNNHRKRVGYITQTELSHFQVEPQIAKEVGRRLRERFTRDA